MADFTLKIFSVTALGLVVGACDRLPEGWPFKSAQSSVTVKLPPARTVAPGFAFDGAKAPAKTELRDLSREE
jgi:hypothetical protein